MAEGGAAMTRRKTMTDKVEQYLAYRRDLGYATRTHRSYLRQFGAYAESIRHRGPLTVALAVQWARLPADRSPRCWAERLKMVRCFARYLAIDEPRTQIPPVHLLARISHHLEGWWVFLASGGGLNERARLLEADRPITPLAQPIFGRLRRGGAQR
jgi:hypothetical protein